MARWEFALEIDRRLGTPMARQIAGAIVAEIQRGRLRPGDRVPGSRTLARMLRVHRQTVVSAIEELIAEGLARQPARVGDLRRRSTSRVDPEAFRRRRAIAAGHAEADGVVLSDAPEPELAGTVPPGAILMSGSRPDVRLLPADLIGRAYRRVLRTFGSEPARLQRSGRAAAARQALAAMLSATRGLAVDSPSILLTRGSQMALALTARALVRPGDAVAVEHPGYRPAWEAFRLAGAAIVPMPVDEHGLDVDGAGRRSRARDRCAPCT